MKKNRNLLVVVFFTLLTMLSLCFAKGGSTEYSDLESVVGSEPEIVEEPPAGDLEKTIGSDDLGGSGGDKDFLDDEPAPKKRVTRRTKKDYAEPQERREVARHA